MKTYKLTLKHDTGTTDVRLHAKNKEGAIKRIMNLEGCPKRAIIKIKEVLK